MKQPDETTCLIKERLGKNISINYVSILKKRVRQKGRDYISLLAKNRDILSFQNILPSLREQNCLKVIIQDSIRSFN